MNGPAIGRPIERLEDMRFLRGRGCYVDDLERDGLLHGAVLRSSVAHGRIRSIDATQALAMPGVHAVITAQDIGEPLPRIPMRQEATPELQRFEHPVIASAKVRYVGEPMALVVADTPALAEDALALIAVDIETLDAVADRHMAAEGRSLLFEEAGRNIAGTLTALRGDATAAFARAPYVRREKLSVQRHTAMPMETRGLLAEWDEGTQHLTLHGAAKVVYPNRRTLAKHLGLAESSVTLIENDVGGGFGARGEYYPEDFLVSFAARKLKRPVKWIEDRRENMMAMNHARDMECELEIACLKDGTIIGLRGQIFSDIGAYIRSVGATPARNVIQILSGAYRIPNIAVDAVLVLTNKTPVGTYRGPGRFEADFFRERMFDMVAADLGIDRVEFRRRNLVRRDEMPWRLATVQQPKIETECDSGDYHVTFERCLQEFGWQEKQSLRGKLVDGRRHGIAIGCYIEGGASGPKENARLALDSDGMISVYTGSSSVGQALETSCAQIAADAMEMPLSRIRGVYHGSTIYLHDGFGTYSSRSVVMGGSAIVAAAKTLRGMIAAEAALRLNCAAEEIRINGDHAQGPDGRVLALGQVAGNGLSADGSFSSHKRTYSYGAHAAHVAVDVGTGHVAVLDYVAVEDVGRIINPLTLHGRTLGAIVQGLGGAFLEQLVYDAEGQLLTGTFADYLLPTATDFPNIRLFAMELHPSPNNPLGAKGAGEGGIIPVGGVIGNAIADALAALKPDVRALPLSPARVWALIQGSHLQQAPGVAR